jgi:hypothetical protein
MMVAMSMLFVLLWTLTLIPVHSWILPPKHERSSPLHLLHLTSQHRLQRKLPLTNGDVIDVISRTIALSPSWNVTIWEQDEPADIVAHYWNTQSRSSREQLDPFGLVSWPGSVVAAQELQRYCKKQIQNATVLVLGAGTGVEAQAVAMLGASRVIATDIHPTALDLLRYGAQQAGLADTITTMHFDLFGTQPLPPCDVVLAADVLYSSKLAMQVGERIRQVLTNNNNSNSNNSNNRNPPMVLVTDSQRFHGTDFVPALKRAVGDDSLAWEERDLEQFTGSGVMVNEDQTYNVKVRVLAIGFDKQ